MVFPVVMYGCENWTVKKAECRKIDAFELRCWKRLLRVPWTERRSNQSILKEISHGCSLEGLTLKLKLQYFGHLLRRIDSLEKTLMLGGIGGRKRRGRQRWDGWMASPTQWAWVWVNSRSWWWTERPGMLQSMGLQRIGHGWATELNWAFEILTFSRIWKQLPLSCKSLQTQKCSSRSNETSSYSYQSTNLASSSQNSYRLMSKIEILEIGLFCTQEENNSIIVTVDHWQ